MSPTVHTVEIRGDRSPLRFDPDPVEAYPGDRIEWAHAGADSFVVHIEQEIADPADPKAQQGARAATVIRGQARPGRYKYSVTIYVGDEPVEQDPEIIVKPRG
jgi:plastocyanin